MTDPVDPTPIDPDPAPQPPDTAPPPSPPADPPPDTMPGTIPAGMRLAPTGRTITNIERHNRRIE
jgi:hypothetical protein